MGAAIMKEDAMGDGHIPGCACCAAGGDLSVLDERVAEVMQRCGWVLMTVPHRRGYLGYTLGLGRLHLPELYLEAPHVALLGGQLNALAERQKAAGAPWQAGDVIALERGGNFRVDEITTERLPMVRRFYGRVMPAWRMRPVA